MSAVGGLRAGTRFLLPAVGVAVGLMVLLPVILIVAVPPTPQPIPACGSEPTTSNPIQLAPGVTQVVFEDFGGGIRITVWSNSSTSYSLFLLTGPQYVAYGNTTGTNGTIPFHPPSSYFWTSGPAFVTNNTFDLGSGDWYVLVYNPASSSALVSVEVEFCNPF
jgi:hypothetical protein